MPVPVLKLTAVQVLSLSCLGVVMGVWIKRRIPLLDRLNIPGPIVGGLLYAVAVLAMRDRVLNFDMDLTLREILQNAFFTTIGFGASLRLFKVGGPQVVLFFVIATVGALLQNGVGIALAKALHVDPLLGIISGSVALTGGPATAAAFGKRFEEVYGVAGAQELGIASAMFGITMGGLLGGWIGGSLIRRFQLTPNRTGAQSLAPLKEFLAETEKAAVDDPEHERPWLLNTAIMIAIAMGLGSVVSAWIKQQGIDLPSYIGAMIVAGVMRNLDDRFHFAGLSEERVEEVGEVALSIFIVMALISLQLWQLVKLALPLLIMLFAQLVLVWLMCVFLSFRAMGRDYESAVMAGGFCGFMLGTTANAMACMTVLTEKYGPAPRAFIVVPLVGASLIDFTNAIIITNMAVWVRSVEWLR